MDRKHIVCFGDSNTHGYCGDAADFDGVPQPGGTMRYSEASRWPMLLQKALGEEYLMIEEGLNGRTTVFEDPYRYGWTGASYIQPCLMSHKPVDLLILMLGTNDTKEWYGATAERICAGMEYIVCRAQNTPCWTEKGPNILVIAPPPIDAGYVDTKSLRSSAPAHGRSPWPSRRSMRRAQSASAAPSSTPDRFRSSTAWTACTSRARAAAHSPPRSRKSFPACAAE